ncbi:MAG: HAMP domain-containing histidine kinase [Elusimicrobia bacterium]|nr:HAMP domain-containing histidine kinase [Elusimicrobiota bacterium]
MNDEPLGPLPARGGLVAAAAAAAGPCWLAAVGADAAADLRRERGDAVAERLAARLGDALRSAAAPGDVVGRLAPDTLGVLVTGPRAAAPAALLAAFHGAASRASRVPVSAGAAAGDPLTVFDRAEAALAAARRDGGGRALLEGGASSAPAQGVAPDSLAARYQRLVLLNRVGLTLFSKRPSDGGLAAALPYILALSAARSVRAFGPHGGLGGLGEKTPEGPAFLEAYAAARERNEPAWRAGGPNGWYALPLAVAGTAPDGALMFAFPPEQEPGGDLAAVLADVARSLQAALRSEEMDRLKDEFVALVTHDLRTPLTSIRGFADTLLNFEEKLPLEERRRFTAVILREAKRMSRMVDDFLDLSRLEAGAAPLRKEALDLSALFERVVETLRGYGSGVRFALTADGLPPLSGDVEQLERVLVNLGSNAVKYSPKGGVVSFTARAAAGAVQVTVADQGPGVPAEARPHLFEKFFRAADAVAARTKGTGLGLAAAKAIVVAHGGAIRCEDGPGGGAAFVFTLPVE